MKRILIWILWLLAAGIGLLVCLWLISRLRGPSSDQADALALMQERAPVPAGGNAFPAMWLLAYDVPESQLQAVAEVDLAQSKVVVTPEGDGMSVALTRTGMEQFEDQTPSRADKALFCTTGDGGCLERVHADPVAYDGLIERNRELLDRVVALQGYGYYRRPESDPVQTMSPPFQYAVYDLTRVAWQFSRGEVDTALAGACDGAQTWRRLGAHSDSFLARSVSTGNVEGYTRLVAQMLGELPSSHEVPASCAAAFAPSTVADASICEAMRGEIAMSDQMMRQSLAVGAPSGLSRLSRSTYLDVEKTSVLFAAGNAWACSEDTKAALQSDIRVVPPPARTARSLVRLECVANLAGCVFSDIAFPAYYPYQSKAQDHAARLELMAALLWLRSNASPGEPLQAQLMRYWEENRRGEREIRFEDNGRLIAMELYGHGPEWWSLPFFPEGGKVEHSQQ